MRTIPAPALALLATQQSVEPINIIAVEWKPGKITYYSDKGIGEATAKILEFGSIDDAQRSDSSGSTGAVNVKLDDTDGSLKDIFDKNDIHMKKVNVYQTFDSIGFDNKFLVLSGQISSPIIWDEGARTLAFDVVSRLEDREVGWSAEMGRFELVAQELLGRAWPMAFGTVQHIPALQLQNIPTAFTTDFFGLPNPDYDLELARLTQLEAQAQYNGAIAALFATYEGRNSIEDPETQKWNEEQLRISDQRAALLQEMANQPPAKASVPLIPTVNITKPFRGRVRVGNNLFTATMSNLKGTLDCRPLMSATPRGINVSHGAQFYDVGSQVVIADNYPIEFVASIVPGTVLRVWAMRSFNGLRKMTVVPRRYYEVSTKNYGGQTATIVTLKTPLSTAHFLETLYPNTWDNNYGQTIPIGVMNAIDWDDQIYVTFQSSIGPNPVDIMEYLIETYSELTFDTESFDYVKSLVASNPMNFVLTSQPNVMDLLSEIAYQARCVIYLRDDVFHLKFLPEKPEPVDEITEDDILVGSLEVTTSSTENLVTKYVATYRPDYSPEFSEPTKLILRFNINKYGTHTEQHDFTCYNNYYSVEKAAAFWMIRKSNTWKIIRAKLFITKLNLEVFDAVTLNFNKPYVASSDVVGILTSVKYNSTDHLIDVEIWTPVRVGEMRPYEFAWPSGLTKQDIFPTYRDIQAGSASGQTFGNSTPLPPSNSNRNPIGILNDGSYVRNSSGVTGLNDRLNWTTGPAYFSDDYEPIPLPDPNEQSERFTPLPVGNTFESDYEPYESDLTLDLNSNPCIPIMVLEYSGEDQGRSIYKVEAYFKGLDNESQVVEFTCLQIDPDERIPNGTWALGSVTRYQETDTNGDLVDKVSYAFQIPVWLG